MNIIQWTEKHRGILTDNDESLLALDGFNAAFEHKTAILYGYGLLGRSLGLVFKKLGIEYLAVDRNAEAICSQTGFDVRAPQFLKTIPNPEEYVLIASVNRLKVASVRKDHSDLAVPFPIPVNGHELHITLQSALCTAKRHRGEELILKDCYECSILDNTCPVLAGYLRDRSGFAAGARRTAPAVKMIGYVLGNLCSLKCRNCCESVPFIDAASKSFVPAETVLADIQRYAEACEYITLLEFIGGEPFLHPGIADILTEALKIPNIGVLHIFSNGTVFPKPQLTRVLADPRIVAYISNYSTVLSNQLNQKVARTVAELERRGVSFVHGSNANWYDISTFDRVGDEEARLQERYRNCFLHTCNRLHHGNLYRCPHHFSGVALGKIDSSEVVPIHEGSEAELVKRLDAFAAKSYAEACRYCPMPFNAPFVTPGIQL
jgi:hypothetical protein